MRCADKDPEMGAYNITIQVAHHDISDRVPARRQTVEINRSAITFRSAGQSAPDDVIFRVQNLNAPAAAAHAPYVEKYSLTH